MATIKDLFKKQNKDLYGLSGKLIIESRGLINPPRAAALLTSSPNALADMIGNQIGGLLKGSANRPSDTIFKNNFFRSQLNLKSYSISIVISSLIKLFTSVFLIYLYALKGAIISIILNRIINFFLSFYLVKKYHSKVNVKYNL